MPLFSDLLADIVLQAQIQQEEAVWLGAALKGAFWDNGVPAPLSTKFILTGTKEEPLGEIHTDPLKEVSQSSVAFALITSVPWSAGGDIRCAQTHTLVVQVANMSNVQASAGIVPSKIRAWKVTEIQGKWRQQIQEMISQERLTARRHTILNVEWHLIRVSIFFINKLALGFRMKHGKTIARVWGFSTLPCCDFNPSYQESPSITLF